MNNKCKYLKIEAVTSWHEDVFDHPNYKYYCTEKNKDLPFGILQCHKCAKYSRREEKKIRRMSYVNENCTSQ